MKPHWYVSFSRRTLRNGKSVWRVALKHFDGDLNRRDYTAIEETFRSEASARKRALALAKEYACETFGLNAA